MFPNQSVVNYLLDQHVLSAIKVVGKLFWIKCYDKYIKSQKEDGYVK